MKTYELNNNGAPKGCVEVPIDSLYYDPELPTKTITPIEFLALYIVTPMEFNRIRPEDTTYDTEIIRMYVEEHRNQAYIAEKLNINKQFIMTRLYRHNIVTSKHRGKRYK